MRLLVIYHKPKSSYLLRSMREVRKGLAVISVRQWSGVPYRSKQVELKRITAADNASVQRVFITYNAWLGFEASVGRKELFGAYEREPLAHNDGLDVWDFSEWFFQRGKVDEFSGVIIHFTNFRY